MTTDCATLTDPTIHGNHPAWCCGEHCDPTGNYHLGPVTSWSTGEASFHASLMLTDEEPFNGVPQISVGVDSSAPGAGSYLFFYATPAELRLTAEKLLTLAKQAESGWTE